MKSKLLPDHMDSKFMWSTLSVARKVIWVVAISICFYCMVNQTKECLNKLFNPVINTKVTMRIKENISYPAVTFCYKNPDYQGYNPDMLLYYNVSGYWSRKYSDGYLNNPWKTFDFSKHNLSTVWSKATYEIRSGFIIGDVNVPRIRFLASHMGSTFEKFTSRFYHDHGNCITFQTTMKAPTGVANGYKFHFFCYNGSLSPSALIPGVWDVFVHDSEQAWWTENPLVSYRGDKLSVVTGKEVFIKIGKMSFSSLDREGNQCENGIVAISHAECLEKCRWKHIVEQPGVNCSLPFMPMDGYAECNTYDTTIEGMERYRLWTDSISRPECKSMCKRPCTVKVYSTAIARYNNMQELSQNIFNLYYPNGFTQEMQEEWGYDMSNFIADFGGSLGFLLGVSILSVMEILESLMLSLVTMCKKKRRQGILLLKHKREQEEMESEQIIDNSVEQM